MFLNGAKNLYCMDVFVSEGKNAEIGLMSLMRSD